jgi:hypothetical protein
MVRRTPEPDVVIELTLSPLSARHLKAWLEGIIPTKAAPEHIRHTLFKLHSKLAQGE